MLQSVLTPQQQSLLRDERRLLSEALTALSQAKVGEEDLRALRDSIAQLDELFLLVVVGEFNAGKSALINALLGSPFLQEGVTPTTRAIHLLHYGPEPHAEPIGPNLWSHTLPVDWLREINIVDTPGTNAVLREHEILTTDFIPRSDLVLFVTSADRPFTESERRFIQEIRTWGKKIVLILNKIDLLEREEDLASIEEFIREHALTLLGFVPEIFPLSARLALRAKQTTDPEEREALFQTSRFLALERFILQTLNREERIRLKLLNPLGVAQRLLSAHLASARAQHETLRSDLETLETIEGLMRRYRDDMESAFRYRLSELERILYAVETRGLQFFDETMRLLRLPDLLRTERLRRTFVKEVIGDMPREAAELVEDTIDWLAERNVRQWEAITGAIEKRREIHTRAMAGMSLPSWEPRRRELLGGVLHTARTVIASYDHEREADAITESIQRAIAEMAVTEAGAVGLGALLTAILSSTAADLTGVLTAGVIAALGLFILPVRRQQAKARFQERLGQLRRQLIDRLSSQFHHELDRAMDRMRETISPYADFVRLEDERLSGLEARLQTLLNELSTLQARIEKSEEG